MIESLHERGDAGLFAGPSSGPSGCWTHGRSAGVCARPALRPDAGLYSAMAAIAA